FRSSPPTGKTTSWSSEAADLTWQRRGLLGGAKPAGNHPSAALCGAGVRQSTDAVVASRREHRRVRWALAIGCAGLLLTGCGSSARQPERPVLQKVLDSLVTGRFRVAPGAAAYVSGPRGTWEGASGLANVSERVPMTSDVRSRVGSVSKLWTATV